MPEKQKIIVEFELEIFETDDERELASFWPVSIDTGDVSHQHLTDLLNYLKHDDDADFDTIWELKALLSKALD